MQLLQSHEKDRTHGKYFLPLCAVFLLACRCWYAALFSVFLQGATWEIPLWSFAHGRGSIGDVNILLSTSEYLVARFAGIQAAQAGQRGLWKGRTVRYTGSGPQGGCLWAGGEDATW